MTYITREEAISILATMAECECLSNNTKLGEIADCIFAEGLGHTIWGKDKEKSREIFPD